MEPQAELFNSTKQASVEAGALRDLWIRLIPGCKPTLDAVDG